MFLALQVAAYALAVYVVYQIFRTLYKWYNIPPGPWGLPYFGYLFFLPRFGQFPNLFMKLKDKYGPIFYMNFGMNETIVLNDSKAIMDIFKRPDCQDGTDTFTLSIEREVGASRLFAMSGQEWAYNRKIANKAIGMLSTTKNSRLETNAQKGTEWLLSEWRNKVNTPFAERSDLKKCTCAVQGSLVFGGDPSPTNEFVKLITSYQEMADFSGILNSFLEFFPRLRFLYRGRIAKQKVIIQQVVKSLLQQYELVKHDKKGGIRIMDALEKAIKETPEAEKKANNITDNDIRLMLMDLYDGGCFSLADKLEWAMVFMGLYPETVAPMVEELDSVLAEGQLPAVSDLDACPYTRAFLSEAMRYSASTATALTHSAGSDIWYRDYLIPKGSVIWANVKAAHFDDAVWPDPYKFDPYRFLDSSGQYSMEVQDKMLAFGFGKRRCPGEIVAYPIMFIYMAAVAKSFDVEMVKMPGIDPVQDTEATFLLLPGDHHVILRPRYKV